MKPAYYFYLFLSYAYVFAAASRRYRANFGCLYTHSMLCPSRGGI